MTVKAMQIKISDAEHEQRCEQLVGHLQANNLSGVVLFEPIYILYYTGFAFGATERPMALLINSKGDRALFVPRLELEHAQANALVQHVFNYMEYPHEPHPLERMADVMAEMGLSGRIGADSRGYPPLYGYRGPDLTEIGRFDVSLVRNFIEDQMAIKSEAELRLIRESVTWGNLAHMLLQRYTKVGVSETEVSNRASHEANVAMLTALGPIYRAQALGSWGNGAEARYSGRIGRNTTIPHALANNIIFQKGDLMLTFAGAPVWGYNSELERNFFLGTPPDEQRRYFDHSVALQQTAFEALKPGIPCAEVDRAVRAYYEKHDLMQYWQHHVGHAIGLRGHEGPFLDIGDKTILQPGMVFTIEPGIYVPGVGGFRQSDTVVITEDGIDILTYYPRDIESLTIPA